MEEISDGLLASYEVWSLAHTEPNRQFNDIWETCAGALSLVGYLFLKHALQTLGRFLYSIHIFKILFSLVLWTGTPKYVKINS